MAWDPGPAGYKFVRQSVYSLWRGTVGGGGLALLLNPLKVIVLSHVRVMETIAKKDSQQNPIQHGTHALHPSLSLPDYGGKHRAQNAQTTTRTPQGLLWIFFIQWVTVPRREKWLEYP